MLFTIILVLLLVNVGLHQFDYSNKRVEKYFLSNFKISKKYFRRYLMVSDKEVECEEINGAYVYRILEEHKLCKFLSNLSTIYMSSKDFKSMLLDILISSKTKLKLCLVNEDNKIIVKEFEQVKRFQCYEDLYWALLFQDGQLLKLDKYFNNKYEVAEYFFRFKESKKDRFFKEESESVIVRWVGAYNTFTTEKSYSFEESLEWECSKKNREVASQIFHSFDELVERTNNPKDTLDYIKIGIMYNNKDVTDAYLEDSYSFSLGSILLPKLNVEKFSDNKIGDYEHGEAYVAANAQPIAIVLRKNINNNDLEIVTKIAKEKGLEIIRL